MRTGEGRGEEMAGGEGGGGGTGRFQREEKVVHSGQDWVISLEHDFPIVVDRDRKFAREAKGRKAYESATKGNVRQRGGRQVVK